MTVILFILSGAGMAAGLGLLIRLIILFHRFTPRSLPTLPPDLDELPTVSVCIPARNETHAMTQCLERVIASSYPKLEIIVLDDSSVDNTYILIKSFAPAGVRFVEGSPLPEGWLGKTHAQHELFKEASGEYILYLDVDTHLAPQSIDTLIALSLHEKTKMISLLPIREDYWRASVLFATLRHFWSLITHVPSYPAASSSVWLVERQLLKEKFEGLGVLRTAIAPERIVAGHAAAQQAYRFIIGTTQVGISYEKKWLSQCETSIRLIYPFFGGRIPFVLMGLTFLVLLLAPFAILVSSFFTIWSSVHTAALIASCMLLVAYMFYTAHVWRGGWVVGGLLFPVILVQECILFVQSIYAYATHTVTWKGRPIRQTARSAARGE